MSRLTELISKIKSKDSQLGIDLEREFKALSSRREFGLNFERHRPEIVELPSRGVRKGDKVRILPKRGSKAKCDPQLWLVSQINKSKRIATLVFIPGHTDPLFRRKLTPLSGILTPLIRLSIPEY